MTIRFYLTNVTPLQATYTEALSLLTPRRRQRLDTLHGTDARLRVMGAGLLLRRFLHVTEDGQLQYQDAGKPFLHCGPAFSLSHSGAWCALAIADSVVGMDIETPRNIPPGMFRRCLTDAELAWCGTDSSRFLQLWTRKESVMKASGGGLKLGLRNVQVLPGEKTTADGKVWTTETFPIENCICSISSAENEFVVEKHLIPADTLLGQERTEAKI